MRIQIWHILVLAGVIILLFGANRLPDVARNLGKSMKIMKEEVKDLGDSSTPSETPAPGVEARPSTRDGAVPGTVNPVDTTASDPSGVTTPPGVTQPGGEPRSVTPPDQR